MESQKVFENRADEKKYFKIITGEDWNAVKVNDWNILKKHEADKYSDYFKSYNNMPQGDGHSPLNLGIYFREKDNTIQSSQYIGVMPLLNRQNLVNKENKNYIAIHPRFNASAVEMIKYVLRSDDFYENSDAIKFRDFEIKELYEYPEQFNEKENKILFGMIKDLEDINIDSMSSGNSNYESLVDSITVFEIWNFISKARTVCQKMLKHQSEKVEENFVGKVKGRIELQKQIKKNLSNGRVDRTYCVYNKLTIDNVENRILKYALYLCERGIRDLAGIDIINEHLAYCKRALSPVKLTKCRLADFRGIKNNGIYRHYKPAIEAARKIIKRISVSFVGDKHEHEITISKAVQPFFIDMNVLFELYCRALVRDSIRKDNCTLARYGKSYKVLDSKLKGFIETLIPDIVVEKDGIPLIVIDAKYSALYFDNRGRTHQILAYMLLLNCSYGGFIHPEKMVKEENVLESKIQSNEKFGFNIGIDISEIEYGKKAIGEWINSIVSKNSGGEENERN